MHLRGLEPFTYNFNVSVIMGVVRLIEWFGKYTAEIIALCALAFTAYQIIVQRRHNVLSVKPHITTFTNRNKNKNIAQLQVQIMNNGLGPAFIDKFQVYLSGQACEPKAAINSILKGMRVNTTITSLSDQYAMSSGEVRNLLAVIFPCSTDEDMEKMEQKLDKLDLEIQYSSAYGEKFVYDSR